MTLWRTYYHIVWATYCRQPLIFEKAEPSLYDFIRFKSRSLDCSLHSVGGMADHLHLIVSIPPKLSIAEFVKMMKGSSSRYLNLTYPNHGFAWQREYGVFSLGSKQLEQAIAYVEHQKQHHREQTIICSLEMTDLLKHD